MLDIVRCMKEMPCKKVPAGGLIEGTDDMGKPAMYLLIAGQVSVLHGEKAEQTVIYPQEAFGGHAFFGGSDSSLYIAQTDSVLCVITKDTFLETARSCPEVVYEILRAAYTKPQEREKTVKPQKPAEQAPPPQKERQETLPAKEKPEAARAQGSFFPAGHRGYPGIVHPEYKKLIFAKSYTCPNCARAFEDHRMFISKLIQEKPTRYDLRTYYKDFRTEWYEIITCPHCLFSMFHNYYTEPKSLARDRIKDTLTDAQQSVFLDFQAERDIGFVFAAHYLALRCADGYGLLNRQIRAKLWGNLSWLYEDAEDTEMARYAAEQCAKAYEALYMHGKLTTAQEQSVCLTIAGMLYRAGIHDNLMKYLFMAKTSKAGNRKYVDLADDLRDMLREQ